LITVKNFRKKFASLRDVSEFPGGFLEKTKEIIVTGAKIFALASSFIRTPVLFQIPDRAAVGIPESAFHRGPSLRLRAPGTVGAPFAHREAAQ